MTFQSKIHVETLDLFVQTYVCLSGCKKCSFFGKFGTLCFLVTSVLRFAFLPYHQRNLIWWITTVKPSKKEHLSHCWLCFKTHIPCAKSFQIWSFFWSIFSRIRTDHGKIQTRKNSVFGHSSRSDCSIRIMNKVEKDLLDINYLSV